MRKFDLSKIHEDILESKGVFKIYLVLLALSCAIVVMPDIPVIALFPRLIVAIIGIVYLLPIYIKFKSERDKKQNRMIGIYTIMLIALTVSSIIRMIS